MGCNYGRRLRDKRKAPSGPALWDLGLVPPDLGLPNPLTWRSRDFYSHHPQGVQPLYPCLIAWGTMEVSRGV
jgi:hypothetical protein